MKTHVLIAFVLAVMLPLMPTPAAAWGREGHRIVAAIADAHLNPQARQEVARMLSEIEPGASMESVADWADTVRTRDTSHWHFMNYPKGDCRYQPPVECADGNCLVAAFDRELAVFRDHSRPLAEREVALKYLIHLAGDAEMPLHDWAPDHGGNGYQVQLDGRGTNIHHVWDTELIRRYASATPDGDSQEPSAGDRLAAFFGRRHAPAAGAAPRPHYQAYTKQLISESFQLPFEPTTDPIVWTQSACRVANRPGIYPDRRIISDGYVDNWRPTVELAMIEAGLQLAQVLNESYGTPHDSTLDRAAPAATPDERRLRDRIDKVFDHNSGTSDGS